MEVYEIYLRPEINRLSAQILLQDFEVTQAFLPAFAIEVENDRCWGVTAKDEELPSLDWVSSYFNLHRSATGDHGRQIFNRISRGSLGNMWNSRSASKRDD